MEGLLRRRDKGQCFIRASDSGVVQEAEGGEGAQGLAIVSLLPSEINWNAEDSVGVSSTYVMRFNFYIKMYILAYKYRYTYIYIYI